MKKSVSILIILVIVLSCILSFSACKKKPKETTNSDSNPVSSSSDSISSENAVPPISSESTSSEEQIDIEAHIPSEPPIDLCSFAPKKEVTIKISSMPKKYEYMLRDDEKEMAQNFIDDFKTKDQYKLLLEETGQTEIQITVDNVYKSYHYGTKYLSDTLKELNGINKLVKQGDMFNNKYNNHENNYRLNGTTGAKVLIMNFDVFNKRNNKNMYYSVNAWEFWPVNYTISNNDIKNEQIFLSALVDPNWLNGIKKAIGANEIYDVIILTDGLLREYYYFKTDKGDYVSNIYWDLYPIEAFLSR